ncbi:MAG: F0F1 ATP synthase subunit B [Erysipelotrichaceae bacterium]|nr:F0F1 ATP synthase subunit B [Erysipelotrichaceae bacterium]
MTFDIEGVLFPNILTMAVQLCATVILFLLCKKLLWAPARKILEARQEKMVSLIDDASKKQSEATSNLEEAKKELVEARNRSTEIVESARSEAKNLQEQIVKQAKEDAKLKLEQAERKIEMRQKEVQNELHDEMVEVALAAVSKLLDEKATSKDDELAIAKYVDEVSGKQ